MGKVDGSQYNVDLRNCQLHRAVCAATAGLVRDQPLRQQGIVAHEFVLLDYGATDTASPRRGFEHQTEQANWLLNALMLAYMPK